MSYNLRIRAAAAAALCTLSLFVTTAAGAVSSEERLAALRAIPPSPEVSALIEQYRVFDPTARFTLFRGHVDAFSARPKATVPDYARGVLEQAGVSFEAVEPIEEETSFEPKGAEGDAAVSAEAEGGGGEGEPGPDDPMPGEVPGEETPEEVDVSGPPTTWYEQSGEELAEPILRRFLQARRDLFELGTQWLAPGLPDLELEQYGVGQQFRRAAFSQKVAGVPVLDSKTVVLFDLNWNVVVISRQLLTKQKLDLSPGEQGLSRQQAETLARQALDLGEEDSRVLESERGIDMIRQLRVWKVLLEAESDLSELRVTLHDGSGEVLHLDDETARYNDAKVKRWKYVGGDMTLPQQVNTSNVYTHDDNTLVHDFFYLVNDDRNDGGTGLCGSTPTVSNSTPPAYGTTTSSDYVRPSRRSDRDFSGWFPWSSAGAFGESHVYYWARKYVQWQKQALVDLGFLTLGNFNNYTKALIIVNACVGGAGQYNGSFDVSTMDDLGEGLGTIRLPERCRSGNLNCTVSQYQANSGTLYTFEGDGGYHFPGVIHHELNHFLMIDYLGVPNSLDCTAFDERKYFQEGGIGRTMPQMYWHNKYNVGYLPNTTNKLFRSAGTSGEVHDENNEATSLNVLGSFSCGTDGGDPYSWGSVVAQPMWEIFHGEKIANGVRTNMGRPSTDKGMIKTIYYAADLTSGSIAKTRSELANRFMEYWELFGSASSTTKGNWCDAFDHHGVGSTINSAYCS